MPYVKQTWVDGSSPLSAARFNYIEAGIAAATIVADFPVAMLRSNAAQTGLAANAWITLNLQVADIDTHSGLATNRWTVPAGQGGIYSVEGGITAGVASGQYLNAGITKNGTFSTNSSWGNVMIYGGANGAVGVTTGRKIYSLVAGDYLQINGYSTAAWSTFVDLNGAPWLSVERIR